MMRHYQEEFKGKQVRFGSDNQVQYRLQSYIDDLTNESNVSPRFRSGDPLEYPPVKSNDQTTAIKLYNQLQQDHKNIDMATRLELQEKIKNFACLNIQDTISKYSIKRNYIILEDKKTKKKRHEYAHEIQLQFKNLPNTMQNELKSKNPVLQEILDLETIPNNLHIHQFISKK